MECPDHEWVETEVHEHCTVQILECPVCGAVSIGWYPDDQPPVRVLSHEHERSESE